ncbi:MAG: hypothetical protein HY282_13205 [Nitrospirae bacterium]|nr:hypothetical protein [Candidatus Manganitrophaceae bacterium]
MRFRIYTSLTVMIGLLWIASFAGAQNTEMNPAVQAELEKEKTTIAFWASNPVIIKEVQQQNKKGPISGLDNAKWKNTPPSDPLIKTFQENPAARFLKSKIEAKDSIFTEAFLSGSNGEKVAFVEKTTYYLHKGMPKFEVPFRKGSAWQGKPEYDESSQTYSIQISTPVFSEGVPIGVLVAGVRLSALEKSTKKP